MNNPHDLPLPPFVFNDLPGWDYAGWLGRGMGHARFAAAVEDWNTPEDQCAEGYADGAVLWKRKN